MENNNNKIAKAEKPKTVKVTSGLRVDLCSVILEPNTTIEVGLSDEVKRALELNIISIVK